MIFLQAGQEQVGFEERYKEQLLNKDFYHSVFIAESPVMKILHEKIKTLASLSSSVFILGAGGTGRETVAREIFSNSENKDSKHFIKFACYGLNQNTIEKKLFGEKKGEEALLNSHPSKTLFIKGIEHFGLYLQNKFLSYLLDYDKKETLPRLICSSSEELSKKLKEGHFSQNLFEVLSQNLLILPSLAERAEDIPFLISFFNKQNGFKASINKKVLEVLQSHSWKGNIKELRNICLQLSILYADKDFITEEDLSMIKREALSVERNIQYDPKLSLEKLINYYIQLSLDHFQSKKKSAKALGISVKTIYNKIQKGYIAFSD